MNYFLENDEVQFIENLVADTQYKIALLMEKHDVSRAELAGRLGVSKSRVTQIFGDRPNITLETLARIFAALGSEPKVTSAEIELILAEQGAPAERGDSDNVTALLEQLVGAMDLDVASAPRSVRKEADLKRVA